MKKILILILCFVGFRTFAQVPFEMGSIKVDSVYMNGTTNWWSGFSTDATFATPSDKKVASQKATSTYIAAQIAAITVGITDTAEVIRLIGAYLDTTNISITANYDAVGDTIFTIYNGNYGYTFSFKEAHQDSLDKHTDSLQVHNTRLKTLEGSTSLGALEDSVDKHTDTLQLHNTKIKAIQTLNTTQGDTLTSHNTRIKSVKTVNNTQGDTLVIHNTRIKNLEAGVTGGIVDTTGLPVAAQISYFTAANKIGGSTNFLFYTDSVVTKKYSNHRDTLFLRYLKGSTTGTRFPVLTSSGGLDSGTLKNASEQLVMYLSPLKEYIKDQKDGELAGYYTKDGELVKNYGLKDNETGQSLGLEAIEILQGHAERAYRFIYRRLIVDNIQWVLMGLLVIGLGFQQVQIRRLRKK